MSESNLYAVVDPEDLDDLGAGHIRIREVNEIDVIGYPADDDEETFNANVRRELEGAGYRITGPGHLNPVNRRTITYPVAHHVTTEMGVLK